MSTIVEVTSRLRERVRSSGLSYKEIARRAEQVDPVRKITDKTVARFVEVGSANLQTLSVLEAVVADVADGRHA